MSIESILFFLVVVIFNIIAGFAWWILCIKTYKKSVDFWKHATKKDKQS